jgi:hypothetical protein
VVSRHNCLLQVSEDTPSPGDTSSFLAQGRWPLLAQTRVLISLHRDDGSRFDWRRGLDAIHAGAVVVTEHSSGIAQLVPGEHLLVASAYALPYVAEDVLGDEQRLTRLRSHAYERLSTWVPFALSVSVLQAAVVELVGEPVPPGASLGELSPRPELADSSRRSLPTEGEPEIEPSRPDAAGIAVARPSRAWAARRAPRVTAVTALRGHDQHVFPTLDSLAQSRLRDFELVVVDGGSSGQVCATVADWISDHPRIAARLVVTEGPRLGAARNIGLDFARGPFFLVTTRARNSIRDASMCSRERWRRCPRPRSRIRCRR